MPHTNNTKITEGWTMDQTILAVASGAAAPAAPYAASQRGVEEGLERAFKTTVQQAPSPNDVDASSKALWNSCADLVHIK